MVLLVRHEALAAMAKEAKTVSSLVPNHFDERALWGRAAIDRLRVDFDAVGLPLPQSIRFGFSTKGNGTQATGECWHSPASADGAYEIFIRADQDQPLAILATLVGQLVHAALPAEDSHGKRYKSAASKIGLTGKMRSATPGHHLQTRLRLLAEELGPLPHASLDLSWSPFEKKKKQTSRRLTVTCTKPAHEGAVTECGYSMSLTSKWAQMGAVCPAHGPIEFAVPEGDSEDSDVSSEEGPPADHDREQAHAL